MEKTVLTFGLLSGAVSAATMLATIPFTDAIGWEKGEIVGSTAIVPSALMVFFDARSPSLKVQRVLLRHLVIVSLPRNMPPIWWSARRDP